MTKDEAMKLALEQRITDYLSAGGLFNPELADHVAVRDLLMDCREALAEQPAQQQDPVANLTIEDGRVAVATKILPDGVYDLYTSPQASKPWVGLTDEDIENLIPDDDTPMSLGEAFVKYGRAIEAKLKEKNT